MMRTGIEKSKLRRDAGTISEGEFKRVCDQIYKDRQELYSFNPGAGQRGALLWMLLGCLISLLSVEDRELESLFESSGQDPYGDAVRTLLKERAEPPFDPQPYLDRLSESVDEE